MRRTITSFFYAALCGTALLAQPLTIYTEVSPPDQFLDAAGKPAGFAVEVVQEIQKRIGNSDPIEFVPWVRGYREIQAKPNVVLFTMARSADRDPLFEWVGPLRESNYLFFVKADSKLVIKSLEDAKKLQAVGVYKEDMRDLYLTKAGFTNLDRSLDESVMMKKLMAGRIDAMAFSREAIKEITSATGFQPSDLRETFSFLKLQIYIAFSKATNAQIVKSWSKALNAMKQDGSFEKIFRKHYPTLPLPGPEAKPF